MRIIVDHYAYVYVKITFLKMLNITDEKYKELEMINDVNSLIMELDKYFPGISRIQEINLINLERELFKIYFKFIEKILVNSPKNMQDFLLSLLYRFEIWNVKTYLLGMIAGIDKNQIKKEIIDDPERILLRTKFIDKLLNVNDIKEAIEILEKNFIYGKAIKRGWHYFKESNEVFMLEALLDKLFCEILIEKLENYKGIEKKLFTQYINFICERYNLNLTFRGIKTKIPPELISQLIVSRSIFFNENSLLRLISSKNIEEYTNHIRQHLEMIFKSSNLPKESIILLPTNKNQFYNTLMAKINVEDPINPIIAKLNKELFKSLVDVPKDNITLISIEQILNLIVTKEREIFKIIRLSAKIFHQNKLPARS